MVYESVVLKAAVGGGQVDRLDNSPIESHKSTPQTSAPNYPAIKPSETPSPPPRWKPSSTDIIHVRNSYRSGRALKDRLHIKMKIEWSLHFHPEGYQVHLFSGT